MDNLVTLVSGHQMFESAYEKRLNYFAELFESIGAKVILKNRPKENYDYSFILSDIKEISKDIYTKLCQAGVQVTMTSLLHNTTQICLKYFK